VLPAIAGVEDGVVEPGEALSLYSAHALMLVLNTVMLVCGVVKMPLGAAAAPAPPDTTSSSSSSAPPAKKTD